MKKRPSLDQLAGRLRRDILLETSGKGLWSSHPKFVNVYLIEWKLDRTFDDCSWDVRAYFLRSDWDVTRDGLIYTDPRFLGQLRRRLVSLRRKGVLADLPWGRLQYTEQGMQGDDHVSLEL